ncbi:hypothetical protein [Endozoicomonas sp. 8E]|nr:hypothetical protein [Endozoicomonas sp. 8E]WOG25388.1 hypothetical protein P6910_12375 [Endozoicomonas sp. 8E]
MLQPEIRRSANRTVSHFDKDTVRTDFMKECHCHRELMRKTRFSLNTA